MFLVQRRPCGLAAKDILYLAWLSDVSRVLSYGHVPWKYWFMVAPGRETDEACFSMEGQSNYRIHCTCKDGICYFHLIWKLPLFSNLGMNQSLEEWRCFVSFCSPVLDAFHFPQQWCSQYWQSSLEHFSWALQMSFIWVPGSGCQVLHIVLHGDLALKRCRMYKGMSEMLSSNRSLC